MEYSVRQPEGDLVVLEIRGDLDLDTVPALDTWLAAAPVSDTVVDLTAVSFMDSTGVGFLIRLWKRALGARRRVVLCGLSPILRRILTVVGIDRWLESYASVTEALGAVRREAPEGPGPAPPLFRRLRHEG